MDRFFELPLSRRILVYGMVFLLLAVLYWYFFYQPVVAQIEEKLNRQSELEAEQTKLKSTLKDRKKLSEDIAEIEARFKEATTQLPEEKEIPELLRQVSNLGRDSGLEITLFRQQAETLQDLHAEVPVEMAVRGGYHQIALFFEKVRHLDRIVNISDIGIKNPQMVDGRLQVDASFFATTYRFLTEEERARIAKQKEEEAKKKGGNGS
jgi:type IV pilus assembly protein PilO